MIAKNQQLSPQLWVQNHSDYLYSYALTRLNDEEQARDLVQETFLAALEKVHSFEGKSAERTWLTAILKNKVIDCYRKKSSRTNDVSLDNSSLENSISDQQRLFNPSDGHWNSEYAPAEFGADIYDPLAEKEFNLILQQCLKKLPVLWLSVFTMKYMDEEMTETICTGLGITSANFWVIIHRAKLNLRACLQKNWL